LTVVVVFPTPPFWFIRAMMRMAASVRFAGPRVLRVIVADEEWKTRLVEWRLSFWRMALF
jgi:hypothetical protein